MRLKVNVGRSKFLVVKEVQRANTEKVKVSVEEMEEMVKH